MKKIKDGAALAAGMVNQYKICYKNRRAMREMLDRAFSK
jgi:hypothetical protein